MILVLTRDFLFGQPNVNKSLPQNPNAIPAVYLL